MSNYVAAYDISSASVRRRVARVLSRYGRRVQRSVFEVRVSREELDDFLVDIGALLDTDDDFDLIPMDVRASRRALCWRRTKVTTGGVRYL